MFSIPVSDRFRRHSQEVPYSNQHTSYGGDIRDEIGFFGTRVWEFLILGPNLDNWPTLFWLCSLIGCLLVLFGDVLGPVGSLFGTSWDLLGSSWGSLGSVCGPLASLLGTGASGMPLGGLLGLPEALSATLGTLLEWCWCFLGVVLRLLGAILGVLGPILGQFG